MTSSFSRPNLDFEQTHWQNYNLHVIGVDEVGRGCLAGPLLVAAVMFSPSHRPIEGVTDSKLLTPKKRAHLSSVITKVAAIHFGTASVDHINKHGITRALAHAINQAIAPFTHLDHILIDGRDRPTITHPSSPSLTTIIKGDRLCYSIAAASIVAKVKRDSYMQQLHKHFPNYDWHHNKGYGTKAHRQALITHGATIHHRTLFIRNTLNQALDNPRS